MGGGKGYSMPETTVDVPAPLPTSVDTSVKQAGDNLRRRRASMAGASSTMLTGGMGLSGKAKTDKKTLLGG